MTINPNQHFVSYLKNRNIYYEEDLLEGVPRITMAFTGFEHCPSERVEACVYFHKDSIEARLYYAHPGPEAVSESEHISDLYRLLNWVNAMLFPKNMDNADGTVYAPSYLVTPRFFLTEDGCNDITAMVVMDNDFFAFAPLEMEDYITVALPWLMGELAPYIFGVLFGNINVEYVIKLIQCHILGAAEE